MGLLINCNIVLAKEISERIMEDVDNRNLYVSGLVRNTDYNTKATET